MVYLVQSVSSCLSVPRVLWKSSQIINVYDEKTILNTPVSQTRWDPLLYSMEKSSPVRKISWNFIPIGKLQWIVISTRKNSNILWIPTGFWAVYNRIQIRHPLKVRDFPSPLAFGYFILSQLAKKSSSSHWDNAVSNKTTLYSLIQYVKI